MTIYSGGKYPYQVARESTKGKSPVKIYGRPKSTESAPVETSLEGRIVSSNIKDLSGV